MSNPTYSPDPMLYGPCGGFERVSDTHYPLDGSFDFTESIAMTYRAIFLFDMAELYETLWTLSQKALRKLIVTHMERVCSIPATGIDHDKVVCTLIKEWLLKDFGLNVYPEVNHHRIIEAINIDWQLYLRPYRDHFYRHLSQAIFYNAHPCLESWCQVNIENDRTLSLTFHVETLNHSASFA